MTDYEAKFSAQGVPINRCVATKQPVEQLPETWENVGLKVAEKDVEPADPS
ncbi:MAG: hypothetical protein LUH48_05145 [Clostridiales bacterium]|nr:hypothetical protein [Clostridiales bacterium]